MGGMLILPATPDTIAGFIAAAEAAPDELSTIANVMPCPPMPFVPAEHHGRLVIMGMLAFAGPAEAGEAAVAPFRALADAPGGHGQAAAVHGACTRRRTAATTRWRRSTPASSSRSTGRWRSTILEHLEASTAMMRVAQLRVLGGAMARVPADATAFAHRDRRIMVNVAALYQDPADAAAHEAWASGFAEALSHGDEAGYVNFLGIEGPARVRAAYPGATWDRLVAIKRRYDPDNLFRHNQNIEPGGA